MLGKHLCCCIKESLLKLFWEKEFYFLGGKISLKSQFPLETGEVTSEEIFVTETTTFQHKIFL